MFRSIAADTFLPLLFAAALLSCEIRGVYAAEPLHPSDDNGEARQTSETPNDEEGIRILRRPGKPSLVAFAPDNKDMQAAVKRAQETLPGFLNTLNDHWPSQYDFRIKVHFKEDEETELIWLSDVTHDGQVLKGKVLSFPQFVKGIERGAQQTVAPQEVVDWAYEEYDRTIGGFTDRVLRSRLPQREDVEPMKFAEPMARRIVHFDKGRGRLQVPEIFDTGISPETGKQWIAPRGKRETIFAYVSFLQEEPDQRSHDYGERHVRAEAAKLGREVKTIDDKTVLHIRVSDEHDGKPVTRDMFLVGWDDHVAVFSSQFAAQDAAQTVQSEFLLGIMDLIQSLRFVDDEAQTSGTAADEAVGGMRSNEEGEPIVTLSAEPSRTGPVEIVVRGEKTRVFQETPGNRVRPASARVHIPGDQPIGKARITGEGHNQDRDGFLRTMVVKINGRVIKVIPAIRRSETKSFDVAVPPDALVSGWNDIQAYIDWSNEEYDRGHWVSLTLTLE